MRGGAAPAWIVLFESYECVAHSERTCGAAARHAGALAAENGANFFVASCFLYILSVVVVF